METIHQSVKQRLDEKLSSDVIALLDNPTLWEEYAAELELAVTYFNRIQQQRSHQYLEILDNTRHLFSLWSDPLPSYAEVIEKLTTDSDLNNKVFTELAESDYFQVIWQIQHPHHLVINLMILFYRTSMLYLHPELRKGKAQISSTLEEMAALLYLAGRNTTLFEAVKHWLQDWEEEEFSEELAKMLFF